MICSSPEIVLDILLQMAQEYYRIVAHYSAHPFEKELYNAILKLSKIIKKATKVVVNSDTSLNATFYNFEVQPLQVFTP